MTKKEDHFVDTYWHNIFMQLFYSCVDGLKEEIENNTIGSCEYIFYKTAILNTFNYLEGRQKDIDSKKEKK